MDIDHAIEYLRGNIHRGYNHCSLVLGCPKNKLKEIVIKNKIGEPENLEFVDFVPDLARISPRITRSQKIKYFIIDKVCQKGILWCSKKIGISEEEILSISASVGLYPDNKKQVGLYKSPSLEKQMEMNRSMLEDFLVENYETSSLKDLSIRTGASINTIHHTAKPMGLMKRGKRFHEIRESKYSKLIMSARLIRIALLGVDPRDDLKKTILKHVRDIENFVMREENLDV